MCMNTYIDIETSDVSGDCVCIHVFTQVYICMHVCVHMYTYRYVLRSIEFVGHPQLCVHFLYLHIFICVCVLVYICICINIYIDIYRDSVRLQRLFAYTGVYMYLHICQQRLCVCIHVNTCIYTHVYIHMYV